MDVIVVGSGGAGLIAALHAASRGASVTVLERAPVFGGTTAISGGGQWLPGNPFAKEFGLQDSPAEVEAYLDRLTLGRVPKKSILSFIREAPRYFDFLAANVPVELEAADIPDYYRMHPGAKDSGRQIAVGLYDTSRLGEYKDLLRMPFWPGSPSPLRSSEDEAAERRGKGDQRKLFDLGKERLAKGITARGRALIGGLMEANLKQRVKLINGARVMSLIQEDGRIAGVRVQRGGKEETHRASSVVLASGGFEWNPTLWNALIGVPLDSPLSPPYNEGDGLRMAAAAGAMIGNVGEVWWSPGGVQIPGETKDGKPMRRGTTVRSRTGSITVNRRGRRFMNENMVYNDAGRPQTEFDALRYEFANYPSFSIMDRDVRESGPLLYRDYVTVPDSSWLFEAPTLRKLAERIGVDPDGLENQVREWNRDAERGVDSAFHRGEPEYDLTRGSWDRARADTSSGLKNPLLRPIGNGPYYAVECGVTCFGTKCGPMIDEEARVLTAEGKPIPGLFAAGNVTSGVFGKAYPGGGATLGVAMTYGFIAGRSASA